jgi:hypothetical protein
VPQGLNGGFAPGRRVRLADVEAGDGISYTAACSERLLGRGASDGRDPGAYQTVPGPLEEAGCPATAGARWHGDAGSSWAEAGWRSSLYNHTQPPGAATSCVADDGSQAHMAASSGHAGGVNVLVFDTSVRTVSPRVALPVWKALATTHSPAPETPKEAR